MGAEITPEATLAPSCDELLAAILAYAPLRVWAIDARGTFTLHRGEFPIEGLPPAEPLVGKNIFELFAIHPHALACVRRSLEGEITSCRVGREPLAFDVRICPRYGADGAIVGVLGVSTSVAELVRAERAFLHEQKLDSLGVLAGGIAHDFNNVLTAVIGSVSAALYSLPAHSPTRPLVENAERAAHRGASLTRQLLAYVGKGRFEVRAVRLSEEVRELSAMLKSSVAKHVALDLALDPELPTVAVDVTQLQQVIMNLVINAAEAVGPEQGKVVVRTRSERIGGAQALFLQAQPGDYVVLEVQDTGCGMDEATLSRIFDPFFTTKISGRGLGLAAVQGIVRAHQGAIQVSSTPGRGTTFRVLLPAMALAIDDAPKPLETPPQLAPGTALIVDDDEGARSAARAIFELLGMKVLEANSGRTGVDLLSQHGAEISIVLLDLSEIDGEETLHRLRALTPNLPIFLTSGVGETETVRRMLDCGLAAFLQKPFSVESLSSKLATAKR